MQYSWLYSSIPCRRYIRCLSGNRWCCSARRISILAVVIRRRVALGGTGRQGNDERPCQSAHRQEWDLQIFLDVSELHELHRQPEEQVALHQRDEVFLRTDDGGVHVQALDGAGQRKECRVVEERDDAQLGCQRLFDGGHLVDGERVVQEREDAVKVLAVAVGDDDGERNVLQGTVGHVEDRKGRGASLVVVRGLVLGLRDGVAAHGQGGARHHLGGQRVLSQGLLVRRQQVDVRHRVRGGGCRRLHEVEGIRDAEGVAGGALRAQQRRDGEDDGGGLHGVDGGNEYVSVSVSVGLESMNE
mmetsp:Transcript_23506/g.66515  ORF Transcript_23506/g.66515 Transcript_23506/m.66515 type:complete len:301 (+) Transcript_23506:103-1005(+)